MLEIGIGLLSAAKCCSRAILSSNCWSPAAKRKHSLGPGLSSQYESHNSHASVSRGVVEESSGALGCTWSDPPELLEALALHTIC